MKTTLRYLLLASMATAIVIPTPGAETTAVANSKISTNTAAARQVLRAERQAARRAARQRARAAAASNPDSPQTTQRSPIEPAEPEEASLRLNFRGVSLDVVLDYLSEAAGYTIILETPVKGTVDVWSNQPLTKMEALDLLNSVLGKNGYAAIQNGKTLTVVSRDAAKTRDIPIRIGGAFQNIPKNDQIVTQVIPVRNINVAQLARDLAPLIPSTATVVANEGGNTLLVTDTQANIHRLAEIVSALDAQVSGASTIKVYPLRYADAKALAATITSLFQNTGATGTGGANRGGQGGGGFPFGGRGIFGGDGGQARGGSRGGGTTANTVATAARVTAVADEHSNSLIVSASESQIPGIELLIKSVDTDVEDLTEVRVFHLKNADPVEMAELLGGLFPSTTQQEESRGGGIRFGGGFPGFGGGRGQNAAGATDTERSKKQGRVLAVADARTGSLVVSAAREIMPQISEMVFQLDTDPAKKKKVFVYNLENANVQEVEMVLRELFESQNTRGGSATQNNALQNRANQANQNQIGNTGTGGGLGGGLGGGGLGGGNR
jgi:general secretion pathway protein D